MKRLYRDLGEVPEKIISRVLPDHSNSDKYACRHNVAIS